MPPNDQAQQHRGTVQLELSKTVTPRCRLQRLVRLPAHRFRAALYCIADRSNRWPNSTPENFVRVGDGESADVTTTRKNLGLSRACLTLAPQ